MFIYGLCDSAEPNVIRYIGKSIDPKARLYSHLRDKSPTHKGFWIRKILREGRQVVQVIIDCAKSEDEANSLEMFHINRFQESGISLTNGTIGGDGCTGFKHTTESIEKTASAHRGMKRSLETRTNISVAKFGKSIAPCSEERREKIRAALTGKPKSYMSEVNKQPWSPERRANWEKGQLNRHDARRPLLSDK